MGWKYALVMGSLFKLTERAWVEYLMAIENGENVDITSYGTLVQVRCHNVTDITREEARMIRLGL